MKPERRPILCRLRLHRWRRTDQTPWLEACVRCGEVRKATWGVP